MIIAPDFCDHWKTRMLVDLLGGDEMAPLYLIRLWGHCHLRRQDTFADLPTPGLKAICHYHGKASEFEAALVQSRWIVRNEDGSLHVRGWTETNSTLIAAWENGKLGGRPPKPKPTQNPRVTQQEPTGNPAITHGEPTGNPDETDKSRVEKSREDKREYTPLTPHGGNASVARKQKRNPAEETPEFQAFYSMYPKHVGRGDAFKAWKAAIKITTADRIMEALRKQIAAGLFRKDDPQYIKHPSSWLNGKRWDDEIHVTPQSTLPSFRELGGDEL